jgi:hypothetical protein
MIHFSVLHHRERKYRSSVGIFGIWKVRLFFWRALDMFLSKIKTETYNKFFALIISISFCDSIYIKD